MASQVDRFGIASLLVQCCIAFSQPSPAMAHVSYVHVGRPTAILSHPVASFPATPLLKCARKCDSQRSCTSFQWDTLSGNCTIGRLAVTGPQAQNLASQRLYSKHACRLDLGYEMRVNGTLTACLFLSQERLSYEQAKRSCALKKGRLLKCNTWSLLYLVMSLVSEKRLSKPVRVRVGLDDLVQEDVFVWSDGQVMTSEERSQFFKDRQGSSKFGDEDCGEVDVKRMRLNDNNCLIEHYYACEIQMDS